MKSWSIARSCARSADARPACARTKRAVWQAALAVLLASALAIGAPPAARAESENGFLFKRKNDAQAAANARLDSGIPATTETKILNDGSVAPFITPDSASRMQALEARYARIVADGGWPEVPRAALQKGSKGRAVAILNQRLYIEGYLRVEGTQGEFAARFTTATEDALERFQGNHGLAVTGEIDGPTLAALNVPADQRLATIKANVPRLAEYSRDLGGRYIVVNVPSQQVEAVSNGTVYSLHNAIVGRPSRPTPVVMTPLTILRFNPYWNAPHSIVEKDIVPKMLSRKPSRVMREMNMKIFAGYGGPEVDPDSVDWRTARVDDYHFRQEPGGENAMATAKIEFNSPFGIYLHDTPERRLFSTANRFYSSGCVRVDKVAILIDWILQGQDGLDQAKIASLAESGERLDVNIVNPPQLRVAYLTSWPTKDGVAAFRQDIYEMDDTGFVVGQPLPVGEDQNGERFVLKPIPRLQQDIDTDNGGFSLASIFGGRTGKPAAGAPDDGVPAWARKIDSLAKKAISQTEGEKPFQFLFGRKGDGGSGITETNGGDAPDDTSRATAAKPKKPAEKVPDGCKGGTGGKLPAGCPADDGKTADAAN